MSGLHEFHNRLRIMRSIDEHELVEAGAFVDSETRLIRSGAIERFLADPFDSFIRADDQTAQAIWSIVEARSPSRKPIANQEAA